MKRNARAPKNALVFAYGSNMNHRQMSARCPGAQAVTVAKLPEHRLAFAGRSARWGGGVATIMPARRSSVVGVVWLVSAANLERLDEFEGYPFVYERVPVLVDRPSGESSLWCFAYVKNAAHEVTPPSAEYLRTILDGYETMGAPVPTTLKRLYKQVRQHAIAA